MAKLECSSKGDIRYSAFYVKVMAFGKFASIEEHYQLCKRFGDEVPKTIEDAKGKDPTHIHLGGKDYDVKHLSAFYKLLWVTYLDLNEHLVKYANMFDEFTDMFRGQSKNCQSDVIKQYVKEGRNSLILECEEFIMEINNIKRRY